MNIKQKDRFYKKKFELACQCQMYLSNVYLTTELTKIFYASIKNKIIFPANKIYSFLITSGMCANYKRDVCGCVRMAHYNVYSLLYHL